ncbi:ragulator complex protein LAMTOR2-like [Xenia sp. Carnegie-2017]|uniref:ragulator complex protein LAMTOR2-like n=1 Tax=Xenia sp. Carnegie-2017 TaxID=2897299 RepID=UPI001F03C34E|nr:ragulator complex protein LAMTOR2-like [Xenia sp. Carnegie-2017]
MLKPKVLTELLARETTGGIMSTILLKSNGSLLAFAGANDKDARVTAAIASSIWTAYHSNIKQSFHTETLNFVLMDCDDGKVAITSIADLLLCLHSKKSVGLGLLKAKTLALAKHLDEPLSQLNDALA